MENISPTAPTYPRPLAGVVELHPGDECWPTSLDDLPDAPSALYALGDVTLLRAAATAGLSIVGARASTSYGDRVTSDLVGAMGADRIVVSGGAYGVDAAAHRSALARGVATIAVLPGGLDRLYPAGNRGLFERIFASGGLIVSEKPVGTAPTRNAFLERNRLVAALTPATVVVEAGPRSGSLDTARRAKELGRRVGAVPGPITSTTSTGCHNLIRSGGAVLISTPEDALALAGAGPLAGADR